MERTADETLWMKLWTADLHSQQILTFSSTELATPPERLWLAGLKTVTRLVKNNLWLCIWFFFWSCELQKTCSVSACFTMGTEHLAGAGRLEFTAALLISQILSWQLIELVQTSNLLWRLKQQNKKKLKTTWQWSILRNSKFIERESFVFRVFSENSTDDLHVQKWVPLEIVCMLAVCLSVYLVYWCAMCSADKIEKIKAFNSIWLTFSFALRFST